jgi:hypothetical protein
MILSLREFRIIVELKVVPDERDQSKNRIKIS